jgi:hypothetical protein
MSICARPIESKGLGKGRKDSPDFEFRVIFSPSCPDNWKDHAMKSDRTVAFFLGAFLLTAFATITAATSPAQAQTAKVPADLQKDYDQFITKFRAALKANDAGAVTEMTKFPFYSGEMRDAAYFRKNIYSAIFPAKIRKCLARGKGVYSHAPNGEDSFTLFCGEDLFLFTQTPEGFRFAEAGVND